MNLKYVITDNKCFALFSDTTDHKSVAAGLWGKPVGAGFTMIRATDEAMTGKSDDVMVQCWGGSQTLNLSARPEDGEIISEKLNNPY